jgi:hypothetical protein
MAEYGEWNRKGREFIVDFNRNRSPLQLIGHVRLLRCMALNHGPDG